MGYQIIQQPNGKYAVWSTVVDDFVMVDATPEDIIQAWVDEQRDRTADTVHQVVKQLHDGEKPYYQFTQTFDECVERIRAWHGPTTQSLVMLGLTKQPKPKR